MRPGTSGFAITPSDTALLPGATTGGILVAVGGTLTVTFLSGAKAQLTVPAGFVPIIVTQVWSTGTAATGLSGLQT
jgi:hypothetical protein